MRASPLYLVSNLVSVCLCHSARQPEAAAGTPVTGGREVGALRGRESVISKRERGRMPDVLLCI